MFGFTLVNRNGSFVSNVSQFISLYFVDVDITHESEGFDHLLGRMDLFLCVVAASTANCTLVPVPSYSLQSMEAIGWRLNAEAVLPPCNSMAWLPLGSTDFVADEPSTLGAAMETTGATASSSATLVSFLTGSSAADVQGLIVLMQSPCSSVLEKRSTSILRYFLSPFTNFGLVWMVLGNTFIALIFLVLQILLVVSFKYNRKIGWLDASAAARFPSITFAVANFLHMGTTYGTFELTKVAVGVEYVVVVVGFCYVLGLPAVVLLLLRKFIIARFNQYTQFLSKPAYVRWLYPRGFWDPTPQRNAFGKMMGFVTGVSKYWAIYHLVVAILLCLFALLLTNRVPCEVRFGLVAAVYFVSAVAVAFQNPHRATVSTLFSSLNYFIMGIISLLMALSVTNPAPHLESAKIIACMVQVILVVLRAVYDLIVMYMEHKHWAHFRNPQMEDLEDDELKDANRAPLLHVETDESFFDPPKVVPHHDVLSLQRPPTSITAAASTSPVNVNAGELDIDLLFGWAPKQSPPQDQPIFTKDELEDLL